MGKHTRFGDSNTGRRNIRSRSLSWRLVLPVPVAVVICVGLIAMLVPGLMERNARDEAIRQGKQIAEQFKTIRGYYTKNVIKKVVKSGSLKPSFNHKTEENGIPLPATFIHDVSALLSERDVSVNLYSAYPFPVRKNRSLDTFQTEAWQYLTANPDKIYFRQEARGDGQVVRVAVPDKMSAKGCVACHNSHPESPKTDWKLGDVRGVLEVTSVITPQLAAASHFSNRLIIAGVCAGLILTIITVLGAKSVTRPLLRTVHKMRELSQGNNDIEVEGLERQDEIGQMARAVQVFKENAIERARLMSENEKEQEARALRQRKMESLISAFQKDIQDVLEVVSTNTEEMQATAESLSTIASQTNSQMTSVSAASEEASANVQAVAAAAEELTASINEISRQVVQTKEVVGKANEATSQTDAKVAGLADAAQKIGDVISLIKDIAEQTNLLALNATIEAARAGEAGKGFAVVASEVKELATQTAKATEAISEQIESIQRETDSSVEAIRGIGDIMNEVSSATGTIAAAVEEQGATTSEISGNVQQAAAGSNEVAESITLVSQAADETQKSAKQVLSASQSTSQSADRLRAMIDTFLEDVAAA